MGKPLYFSHLLVFLAIGLILVSCTGARTLDESANESDISNGEKIYFTSSSKSGERITYKGGPNFGGMMMGAYLTCASCHGPEARGGVHLMHMQIMDAPDIRYVALVSESEEHSGEGHGDEETGEYDLDSFRLAVIEGKHPDGGTLDSEMPRWQMNEEDLTDLFEFLKSIQ